MTIEDSVMDIPSHEQNLSQYVTRSLEEEEDFHFLRFEHLQRLNIVQLQIRLVRLKSTIHRRGQAEPDELDDLNALLERYSMDYHPIWHVQKLCSPAATAIAIRDYEYLRGHDSLDKTETRKRKLLLQRFFQTRGDFGDPFQSHYSSCRDAHGAKIDPLRQALMRVLPAQLTYSSHEKRERKKEYAEGRTPKEVSGFVDRLVRFSIALTGGALLVAPMIIMTLNQSQEKSLVTASAFVVLFAFLVSMVFRGSNIETLASTATYAAVLVVFVGTTTGVSTAQVT
ncbi:uncharacterized protein JN550_002221 [Neoarthrinium moseri]|uniref:uncharacterized protein n=1 Tax=Neoarthrinium moseri TaxID=1658444 RepID=UPI001FDD2AD1|nr:uncharacterized protein JN550_002221 [Neoarthrinium moseri]KAI1874792.1 hypothetical protein JN550_002221 [Neoarthrinium moseri]